MARGLYLVFVQEKLAAEFWVHEVFYRQHLVQRCLIQKALFQDEFLDALAGLEGFLGNLVTVVVANEWVQVGDDTDGVLHVLAAHIGVSGNTGDALFAQRINRVAHDADGLEQRLTDDRLHHVELQLTCLCGHGHDVVVAEDLEAGLVDHLWDNWVDLTRHDGGTCLAGRQIDFTKASAWTGGQQAQVVTDLGQLHGSALDGGVQEYVGTAVRGGLDQVACSLHLQAGDFRQSSSYLVTVAGWGVNAGTNGGGAEVDLQQAALCVAQNGLLLVQVIGKALELIAQGHGDCIL